MSPCTQLYLEHLRSATGGRAELAGVKIGMRVCQFMGEELPESRTWAELKQVAKSTPKPWQFGFGDSSETALSMGASPQPPTISPEERIKVRKLFRAARSGDQASLQQILDEGVDVNMATRVHACNAVNACRKTGAQAHTRI